MRRELETEIRRRAGDRCEYCQFPESAAELLHVIDHIIARQHGGSSAIENLALCCGRCNLYKGPNIAGIDAETGQLTRLFNPRLDVWAEHFHSDGAYIFGVSDIGRTTANLLMFNLPIRVASRRALLSERKR